MIQTQVCISALHSVVSVGGAQLGDELRTFLSQQRKLWKKNATSFLLHEQSGNFTVCKSKNADIANTELATSAKTQDKKIPPTEKQNIFKVLTYSGKCTRLLNIPTISYFRIQCAIYQEDSDVSTTLNCLRFFLLFLEATRTMD